MGKDQELMAAVKAEDVGAVQKLLQRPKPGKATAASEPSELPSSSFQKQLGHDSATIFESKAIFHIQAL
ncbi:UNVERIFIED_CONTAM: hypothetical protein K2H54_005383 [Gekko kuhli]